MAVDIHFHQSLASTGHGQNSFVLKLPALSGIEGQIPGEVPVPEAASFAQVVSDAIHTAYVYDKATVGSPTTIEYKHLTPLSPGVVATIAVPGGGRLRIV